MRFISGILLLSVLAPVAGCLEIDGGAVEVAWVLRYSNQTAAECTSTDSPVDIHRIRLKVMPADEPDRDLCAEGALDGCEFGCGDTGGTTPFNIPAGTYFFGLQPLTADGSPISPSVVAVPAPIRRSIITGDLTDLGIWQMVIFIDE